MSGDLGGVARIFNDVVRPARSVAFEILPANETLAKHPELAPAIATFMAMQLSLKQQFPNGIDAYNKYLIEARAQTIAKLDTGAIPHLSSTKIRPTTPS